MRNGQLVNVAAIDTNGMATLEDVDGQANTFDLKGQQYLDYALVSTTYSAQGKTAERVLAIDDSTLSKEGLYVAVSRAKTSLSLYTADRAALYKRAERSSAKENPSDYLSLFDLVNPDAKNPKATDPARELRSADQSEHVGDCIGAIVNRDYDADARRDSAATGGSEALERATERVARATGHLSRGVRADAAQSHRAAEDASRELAAAAGRQQQRVDKDRKRRRWREIYQKCAAQYVGMSDRECDLLVARQLLRGLLTERDGQKLRSVELHKVGRVLRQGLAAQQLKQTHGKEAVEQYVSEVLTKECKRVEKAQRQSRDQGIDI